MILLTAVQLVLAKYCQEPHLYICILPAMILCMPTTMPVWGVSAAAFVLGMLTDMLSDGVPGLNASALLFCAVLQKGMIRFFIDPDMVERGYSFSFHRNGYLKINLAQTALLAVFFIVYLILDSAGTRSFGFNLLKGLCSIGVSLVFGTITCGILCPYNRD